MIFDAGPYRRHPSERDDDIDVCFRANFTPKQLVLLRFDIVCRRQCECARVSAVCNARFGAQAQPSIALFNQLYDDSRSAASGCCCCCCCRLNVSRQTEYHTEAANFAQRVADLEIVVRELRRSAQNRNQMSSKQQQRQEPTTSNQSSSLVSADGKQASSRDISGSNSSDFLTTAKNQWLPNRPTCLPFCLVALCAAN